MTTMVEKVARAICEASGKEWRVGTFQVASGPNFEIEDHSADNLNNGWRFVARAAIEAVRDEILLAGLESGRNWLEVVDAALSEEVSG